MDLIGNPFSVETPELMDAEEINRLFVPANDTHSLDVTGHVFVHGNRGSGKSMLFRRNQPDCQMLLRNCRVEKLPYFGVYVSIKKTDLDLTDFSLFENEHAANVLSEHMLVAFLAANILEYVEKFCFLGNENGEHLTLLKETVVNDIAPRLLLSGLDEDSCSQLSKASSAKSIVGDLVKLLEKIYQMPILYLRRKSLGFNSSSYDGPVLGFYDFLLPLVKSFKELPFTPSGPFFIFIDDADNLSLLQTKLLNTWVSYRTTDVLSFKIATQMRYKTMVASNGRRIESPHDYSEVSISNVYTGSQKDKYPGWVHEVVSKRLKEFFARNNLEGEPDPRKFFLSDSVQESEINKIATEIKEQWEEKGRGFRSNDDAYRYARPEYIARLGGKSKSSHSYNYAGFDQLVHVSSGIIRHFLDPASKMYALQTKRNVGKDVLFVEPAVQDKVLRSESDKLLFADFDKRINDFESESSECGKDVRAGLMRDLQNLIISLGATFYKALVSEKSERKYFSFAISDQENMDGHLLKVLRLGVEEGYLYESYVGTKEGLGRTRLYVMTRRLAPAFKLDPIGFSAYKFVTCKFLMSCIHNQKSIVTRLRKEGVDSVIDSFPSQLNLEV